MHYKYERSRNVEALTEWLHRRNYTPAAIGVIVLGIAIFAITLSQSLGVSIWMGLLLTGILFLGFSCLAAIVVTGFVGYLAFRRKRRKTA